MALSVSVPCTLAVPVVLPLEQFLICCSGVAEVTRHEGERVAEHVQPRVRVAPDASITQMLSDEAGAVCVNNQGVPACTSVSFFYVQAELQDADAGPNVLRPR